MKIDINNILRVIIFSSAFIFSSLIAQESCNHALTSDGIEMTVRTDKESYLLDDPVILEITITNRSGEDKYIYQLGKHNIDNVYDIKVLTPFFTEKDLPPVAIKGVEDMIIEMGKPKPLDRTAFGNSLDCSENKTKICLHPNARHIERLPLGLLFDLSKERLGLNHTVIVKNKMLSLETKASFKLKRKNLYGPYLTACRLSSVFGDTKAMRLLCDEAEMLMEKIEDADGAMLLTSPEHERLTRCLNIMREIYATVSNRRIDRKPWTCDEGRKMIDACKSF